MLNQESSTFNCYVSDCYPPTCIKPLENATHLQLPRPRPMRSYQALPRWTPMPRWTRRPRSPPCPETSRSALEHERFACLAMPARAPRPNVIRPGQSAFVVRNTIWIATTVFLNEKENPRHHLEIYRAPCRIGDCPPTRRRKSQSARPIPIPIMPVWNRSFASITTPWIWTPPFRCRRRERRSSGNNSRRT